MASRKRVALSSAARAGAARQAAMPNAKVRLPRIARGAATRSAVVFMSGFSDVLVAEPLTEPPAPRVYGDALTPIQRRYSMKTPGGFKSRFAYLLRDHAYVPFAYTALLAVAQPASAQVAFDDVSSAAGFANSSSETWGAAWGDVNGDSYPDIFFSNHRTRATLYRNNRNGTFTEVSAQVDRSATPGWTGGRANVDTHG